MRQDVLDIDEKQGSVEIRSLVDSTSLDAANAEEKRLIGNGFTRSRNMRKIANIDPNDWHLLLLQMDKDALAFESSGMTDRKAFKRLLNRFPAWRCSEGGI